MSFSGHISIFRTISATLKKIVFWAKNHDFCQIWWIIIWYVIWPEVAENLKYVLKCILQVPNILRSPQNAIIQCLSLILLRFQKFSFSPILRVFGHFGENCQKSWFFDIWKKYHLDIKRLHPRYSEVSLVPGEHISRHISNFGPHDAKYGFIL